MCWRVVSKLVRLYAARKEEGLLYDVSLRLGFQATVVVAILCLYCTELRLQWSPAMLCESWPSARLEMSAASGFKNRDVHTTSISQHCFAMIM
jgi:hypothetical protein